jgi:hypothetical protein
MFLYLLTQLKFGNIILFWESAYKNHAHNFIFQSSEPGIDLTHYHNYTSVKSLFTQLQNDFPQLARLYTIGKSSQGRELLVLRISAEMFQVSISVIPVSAVKLFDYFPFLWEILGQFLHSSILGIFIILVFCALISSYNFGHIFHHQFWALLSSNQ